VDVLNISNGARLTTYVIEAPAGSGTVLLNGAAARLGEPGDKVILVTYCAIDDSELSSHKPRVVLVDNDNRVTSTK
jgi:aspartate 1-decarboxylase